ncbi:MAG: hypothetical protein FJY85_16850 [Deltaproteobacteria bacterium]|nr:hypothetical protein [Deltaproteobacteria bacterium]
MSYKETEVEERVYRKYGLAASEHILRNARAIQDNAKNRTKKQMSLEVAVKKAIEWMYTKYPREQLRDLGMM